MDSIEWRDVVEYEGYYQVSNTGAVKSLTREISNRRGVYIRQGAILVPHKNAYGYLVIQLCRDGRIKHELVHRVVAKTFIDNPNKLPEVNHIDGDKTNNSIDNLEWCTSSENQLHAYRTGLQVRSEKSGLPKCPVAQIDPNTNQIIAVHDSMLEACKTLGVKYGSSIGKCCRGMRKTANGYIWRFVNGTN